MRTSTDQSLHEAVLAALATTPRVDAGKVGIAVEEGVATLTGTLGSFTERWAVEATVKTVTGLRGIANELRVDLPGMHRRDDADIVKTIVELLRWNDALPKGIQVEAHDGNVTLRGTIERAYQRREVLDAVRHISGIRALRDEMTVTPHAVSPEKLRHEIESRFQRLASLDAKNVRFCVRPGGAVTLTGTVASLTQADEAESAAYAVPGTTEVHNELLVSHELGS